MEKCRRMKRPQYPSKNWIYSWQWKSSRIRQQSYRSESFAMKTDILMNGSTVKNHVLLKPGVRIQCNTENYVPIVVPSLSTTSSSSSSSSSTSPTSSPQESTGWTRIPASSRWTQSQTLLAERRIIPLFHWNTLTSPELLIQTWMLCKNVASMTIGTSMGQEMCLILWLVSLSVLY